MSTSANELIERFVSQTEFSDVIDQDEFESIDWSGIETELSKRLGTNVKIVKKSLSANRKSIDAESQELVDKSGIFKAVLKSVKVETFNTGKTPDGDYWMTCDLRYVIRDGGTNGIRVLTSIYSPSKRSWLFK